MLLGGRAGDLLGRKKIFIAGLVLFSGASLAGGLIAASRPAQPPLPGSPSARSSLQSYPSSVGGLGA
jgi:MFS family permease